MQEDATGIGETLNRVGTAVREPPKWLERT